MTQTRNRRAGVEDRWTDLKKPRQDRDDDGNPLFDANGEPVMTLKPVNFGKGLRWRARYVDEDGKEHAKGFRVKTDATAWLNGIVAAQETGSYVDPALGKVTLRSFYREWAERQVWLPGTRAAMDLAVYSATFSDLPFSELKPSHVESWVKAMKDKPLEPSTIHTRFTNVRGVIRAAVHDRAGIARDVTVKVKLPRLRKAEAAMTIPTPAEVGEILRNADGQFVAFIALCAFGGLRLGECAALKVGDISFLRKEVRVSRQVQRVNGGEVDIRAPKYGSERTVYAADELLTMLTEHIRLYRPGDDPERWMFPGQGKHPMHQNSVGYWWRRARSAVKTSYRLHDLRHYYASGLIAAGCDVVTVQRALGHQKATVTLNTYAHLWPDAEDRTRTAASSLVQQALSTTADALRTHGQV
ncbi:tyrosine-type recombinase/integrase [Mycolicibacterium fortuitum]|uniref:tyrosine-type recombinase/integrase n=1 Tax=Mycolicibacterium fortuitum TaxID=1766 RepID=UPI001C100D46